MTVISKVYDPGLGRYRDPYPHELPPALRGPEHAITAGQRRASRDAEERGRRAQERQGRSR